MKKNLRFRNRYLFIADIISVALAYAAVALIVNPLYDAWGAFEKYLMIMIITAALYCLSMMALGIYNTEWVYAGASEYIRLFGACIIAGVLSAVILLVGRGSVLSAGGEPIRLKVNGAANIAAVTLICFTRFLVRFIHKLLLGYDSGGKKRLLIIGAGRLAVLLLRDIYDNKSLHYSVVGLVDDDPAKKNMRIYGAKVLGNRHDIENICENARVDEIILAIYTISPSDKAEILNICGNTGKKVKILSGVEAMLTGGNRLAEMREVEIEDLLEREPVVLDNEMIENDICGKCVLVTGGGGSIGSELCRQIIKYRPKRLIVLDIYENTTYDLENELKEKYPGQEIDVVIASVRDKQRLNEIFEKYHPDLVFHAAAHKHVPLMEFSPSEAIKNNVFGTYNVATCAHEHGAKRFVMISTDKAVNPTNIMGASKRLCEMIVQTMQKTSKTEFVAVRFGNVLGSNGSVVPRFKKQIAEGGPVTVTHPEITRYFMTIPEAAQLVLQAAAYARGGEIFILDMGKPVKIYNLARKLISLSGLKPDEDIKIKFTGLRPGEKLYEELLMGEEGLTKTAHSKIFVGQPLELSPDELAEKLNILRDAVNNGGDIAEAVRLTVPTYIKPQVSEV